MDVKLERFSCPWCKERFLEGTTLCPACGETVGGRCSKCGAWVWVGWEKCRICDEPWSLGLLQAARKKRQDQADEEWWAKRQMTVPIPPPPPPEPEPVPPPPPMETVPVSSGHISSGERAASRRRYGRYDWSDFTEAATQREDDRIELMEAALLASGKSGWITARMILGLTWMASLVGTISLLVWMLTSEAPSGVLWGVVGLSLLCFAGFAGQLMGDAHFCERLGITERLLQRVRTDPGERNKFLNELEKRRRGTV